mgnify:CR=1 FL=1
MLQIILTLAIFLILVIPMGKYMYHIATKQKHLRIRCSIRSTIFYIKFAESNEKTWAGKSTRCL